MLCSRDKKAGERISWAQERAEEVRSLQHVGRALGKKNEKAEEGAQRVGEEKAVERLEKVLHQEKCIRTKEGEKVMNPGEQGQAEKNMAWVRQKGMKEKCKEAKENEVLVLVSCWN